MSRKLRQVDPKRAIQVFESFGFTEKRRKGSHVSLTKDGVLRPVVIPDHGELSIGTLRGCLRTAGISVKDFESRYQAL